MKKSYPFPPFQQESPEPSDLTQTWSPSAPSGSPDPRNPRAAKGARKVRGRLIVSRETPQFLGNTLGINGSSADWYQSIDLGLMKQVVKPFLVNMPQLFHFRVL